MKKILAIIATLCLTAAIFTGCSTTPANSSSTPVSAASDVSTSESSTAVIESTVSAASTSSVAG